MTGRLSKGISYKDKAGKSKKVWEWFKVLRPVTIRQSLTQGLQGKNSSNMIQQP